MLPPLNIFLYIILKPVVCLQRDFNGIDGLVTIHQKRMILYIFFYTIDKYLKIVPDRMVNYAAYQNTEDPFLLLSITSYFVFSYPDNNSHCTDTHKFSKP